MNVLQAFNSIVCCVIYGFFVVILFGDMTYSKHTPIGNKIVYLIGVIIFGTLFICTLLSLFY